MGAFSSDMEDYIRDVEQLQPMKIPDEPLSESESDEMEAYDDRDELIESDIGDTERLQPTDIPDELSREIDAEETETSEDESDWIESDIGNVERLQPTDIPDELPREIDAEETETSEDESDWIESDIGDTERLQPVKIPEEHRVETKKTSDTLEKKTGQKKVIADQKLGNILAAKREEVDIYEIAQRMMSIQRYRCFDALNNPTILRVWTGRSYKAITYDDHKQLIYEALSEDEVKRIGDVGLFAKKVACLINFEVLKRFNSGEWRFSDDDFRQIQNRAVFKNKVYDLENRRTIKFSPDLPYYMELDTDYTDEYNAPNYEMLKLHATCEDKDSCEMIDCLHGYHSVPNNSAKSFAYLGPVKDSGKTILVDNIRKTLKSGAKTIDFDNIDDKFAFANLSQVYLLTCMEMCDRVLTPKTVSAIKKLTGEKTLTMRNMRDNPRDIANTCKLILGGNVGLCLAHDDSAFYRRMRVIPFVQGVSEEQVNAELPELLEKERPDIFSNGVRVLSKYIDKNGTIRFPESERSKMMKKSWRGISDYVKTFADKYLVVTQDNNDKILDVDLYRKYEEYFVEYVKEKDKTASMLLKNSFMKSLEALIPSMGSARQRCESIYDNEVKNQNCRLGVQWKEVVGE